MADIAALDGANPIEVDILEDLALLDDKAGLSTSNQKVEEEGNPHAISAAVIHNEKEANAAEALQLVQATASSSAKTEERRSPLIGKPGRYKNPILAIFATMSVARKTMQDVAKSSKEQTRLMKKHWEQISHEVSDHHDTAAKSTDRLANWSAYIGMALLGGPQLIKSVVPSGEAYANFINPVDDWVKWGTFDYLTPSNFANDREAFDKLIDSGKDIVQKMSEPTIQQYGQSYQMANQRDVAVGQQQSDASRTEYQSRQDEKRNEDEAVKTIDQMTQRLMEQEVRAFEVRG
jgi:hypothetical protein